MEFAVRVASELSRLTFFDPCCMKAELYAILKGAAAVRFEDGRPVLVIEHRDVAVVRKASALVKDLVDAHLSFSVHYRPGLTRGRVCRSVIARADDVRAVLRLFGLSGPNDSDLPTLAGLVFPQGLLSAGVVRRRCCRAAFLRGLFLTRGYIAEPARQYLLEFTLTDRPLADFVAALLERAGLRGHLFERKRGLFLVYAKDGESIGTFLATTGAVDTLMEFENLRVVRSTRGDINRTTNFETANIGRQAKAAHFLIERLAGLKRRGGFDDLDPAFRETAECRLKFPFAPLAEIGTRLAPPVTKSTVAYRLRVLLARCGGPKPKPRGRKAKRTPARAAPAGQND